MTRPVPAVTSDLPVAPAAPSAGALQQSTQQRQALLDGQTAQLQSWVQTLLARARALVARTLPTVLATDQERAGLFSGAGARGQRHVSAGPTGPPRG